MSRHVALAIAIVLGGLVTASFAAEAPTQPTAIDRLIRQEDARWNDPRLGITYLSASQPTAVERLVRQEDGRTSDARLGISDARPTIAEMPTVATVGEGGFDWRSAAIGAVLGITTLLAASGLVLVGRARTVGRV